MNAKELLQLIEEFETGFKAHMFGEPLYVEIFSNPNPQEMRKVLKNYSSLRFLADPKTKKVYIFPSDYFHQNAHSRLAIRTPLEHCLLGVVSAGIGSKLRIDLYDLNRIVDNDWSWLDQFMRTDINDLIVKERSRYSR